MLALEPPESADAAVRAAHAGVMPLAARWRVDASLIGDEARVVESIPFVRAALPGGSDPRGPLYVWVPWGEGERLVFRISLEEDTL